MYHLKQMTFELMTILTIMVILSIGFLVGTSYLSNRRINLRVEEEQTKQDERIRQRTNEIELMHRLANMLAACNNMVEAQKIVSDVLPRILGNVNGSVSLMRASRNQLVTQLDWGKSGQVVAALLPMSAGHYAKGGCINLMMNSTLYLVNIWKTWETIKPYVSHLRHTEIP